MRADRNIYHRTNPSPGFRTILAFLSALLRTSQRDSPKYSKSTCLLQSSVQSQHRELQLVCNANAFYTASYEEVKNAVNVIKERETDVSKNKIVLLDSFVNEYEIAYYFIRFGSLTDPAQSLKLS